MAQPIEVYFWPTPNGHKVTIALEEMGLDYALKPVNIGAGDQFKPGFMAISPNNRMPAIIDPNGPGGGPISVFESGAILQYLGRKSCKFYPHDERQRVEVEEWLFWQMANLGPMSGQAGHFRNYAPRLVDDPAKARIWAHALFERSEPALWRVGSPANGSRISRRRLFYRRHGVVALDAQLRQL